MSIVELTAPQSSDEPVSLGTVLNWLKQPDPSADSCLVQEIIIPAARRTLEDLTGLTLASRDFVQEKESFPFFAFIQNAYAPLFASSFPFYFGYGPIASYPTPAIGGLQNNLINPFVIKAQKGPVTAIKKLEFIGSDGLVDTREQFTDYIPDYPGWRIAPIPGQRWPISLQSVNALRITYTAGYKPQATTIDIKAGEDGVPDVPSPPSQFNEYKFQVGIPENLKMAHLLLCSHYYFNRDAVAAGAAVSIPLGLQSIIDALRVIDYSPVDSR